MANYIKVSFDGRTKRYLYPTTTIKVFLEVLRTDFSIHANERLNLLDKDEELDTSCTLKELGVTEASELILQLDATNKISIKIQTIGGKVYELHFNTNATLKDLYESISQQITFTSTFPLLFNHRMHMGKITQNRTFTPLVCF